MVCCIFQGSPPISINCWAPAWCRISGVASNTPVERVTIRKSSKSSSTSNGLSACHEAYFFNSFYQFHLVLTAIGFLVVCRISPPKFVAQHTPNARLRPLRRLNNHAYLEFLTFSPSNDCLEWGRSSWFAYQQWYTSALIWLTRHNVWMSACQREAQFQVFLLE